MLGHFVPIINGKLQMASGKFRNCVGDYIDARCQIPEALRSFSSLFALAKIGRGTKSFAFGGG